MDALTPVCVSLSLAALCGRIEIVHAIETLVAASAGDADAASALGISLETLGAALGHLVNIHALRFTDLLRIGELLCRAQQHESTQSDARHFHTIRSRGLKRDRLDDTRAMADGLDGFFRLLSPEMPSSIKQVPMLCM